jgi:peptide methionine sulfoxide reductase msrA/msrB
MTFNKLTPQESAIIEDKFTEPPFTGEYNNFYANGFYSCRKCNLPLYRSMDKFNSKCGWPSFDDEIPQRIKKQLDVDEHRIEIICKNCHGHLGHIFTGEHLTKKNTRHCVNSLSLKFHDIEDILANLPDDTSTLDVIVVAGGCFWGIEFFFEQELGVLATAPGYTGGSIANPSYDKVCTGETGHAEAVAVVFETSTTNIEYLYKLFFNIHNSTEKNRQGPDIGSQYRSAIFVTTEKQLDIANTMLKQHPNACTEVNKLNKFWIAEKKHHHYYRNLGGKPYCHFKR